MNTLLKSGFLLILAMLMLSCSGHSPYGDPDAQRERARDAQGEMNRDISR